MWYTPLLFCSLAVPSAALLFQAQQFGRRILSFGEKGHMSTGYDSIPVADGVQIGVRRTETLIKTDTLQRAIFNNANFSCIATDETGVIQVFNVGAERMLGYTAAEAMNKIAAAHLHDPDEAIARATALSLEFGTPIAPGFDALVFKAARGIQQEVA
jgi:PAS domain-containing protein